VTEASPVKSATELRDEAARIREFAPWIDDEEVVAEILTLAEVLEQRACELEVDGRATAND
jgi:hypothetical protein